MKKMKYIFFFLIFCTAPLLPQKEYIISLEERTINLPFGLSYNVPQAKPKVGLALSGGGSRALSQIGILKALEEYNIPFEVIVGTSMGSIIGGLYAAGYSVKQLDSIITHTDWQYFLSSDRETGRRDLFIDQKVTEDKAVFSLRLEGFNPLLPTAINSGQKLSNFLNLLVFQAPVHVKENFNELEKKFKAVCTDLVNGRAVVLDSGSLSQAMRASSSVSFLLSPVVMDTLILVDGGLVANIPVAITKETGSDYVIAVNTTSDLFPEDYLDKPWFVADQVISIPMRQLNEKQLERADVVIKPDLNNTLLTNFSEVIQLIQNGYNEAKRVALKIRKELDSLLLYNLKKEEVYISNVRLSSNPSYLEKQYAYRYEQKDSVSTAQIKKDLATIMKNYPEIWVTASIKESSGYNEFRFLEKRKPTINEIIKEGITLIPEERTEEIFNEIKGKAFNAYDVYETIVSVLRQYREKGFSLAALDSLHFDESSGKLKLIFSEGVIDEIEIIGNEKTDRTVIVREFPPEKGDYFKYEDISRGLINLRSTNLFDEVILTVRKENGKNIVVLSVQEKVSGLARFGFRFDNEKKAQFSIDIRDENIFGTGTEFGGIITLGPRERSYVLEHRSNRIFDTYLTYKIDGFYKLKDVYLYTDDPIVNDDEFTRSILGEYRQLHYGVSLSVGTQVRRFGNIIVTGSYQWDEIKNLRDIVLPTYSNPFFGISVSSTIDTQDKYPFPESGVFFHGFYETAKAIIGGDFAYTKFGAEYKNYFTINDLHTISPKVIFGFGDKTLPLSQQFSFGGMDMLYGTRENEYSGRQIFLTSIEYRFKLPFKIFFDTYFKFRYDLGSSWVTPESIRFTDLRHGAGGSIAFNTPLGPAEFAAGRTFYFLKNIPDTPVRYGPVFFYFSIGYYY